MIGDILDTEEVDGDTIEQEEIDKVFQDHYTLIAKEKVSIKKAYIKKLSVTKSLKIAVGLEDNSIEVFELNNTSLRKVCNLRGHKKTLTEVVVSNKEDYLVYSCGHDGTLKLWDTRSGQREQTYKGNVGPFECMDISSNEAVLCAGSVRVKRDAFIVFWDKRNATSLGGYWNSHQDDITQVKFHREKPQTLVSGSSDGLLNVYDVLEVEEEEALQWSLNVGSGVDKVTWLDEKRVACIAGFELQLWDAISGDRLHAFSRDQFARAIKRNRADECYIVDVHPSSTGELVVGGSHADDWPLRAATVRGRKLRPRASFAGNDQLVRCSHFHEERLLLTAGEAGRLRVWAAAASP